MTIDTTAPRSRRALLFGALGGALASVGILGKPQPAAAVDPNDVVLDAVNVAAGTTELNGGSATVIKTTGTGVGLLGSSGVASVDVPPPVESSTGVYGVSAAGHGVYGASDTGAGVYAANNASTVAAIVAEGGPGTAIHGHANAGPVPASPGLTGLYGSAALTGVAIAADSASGLAVRATSSAGHAIRGRGQLDGVIGESPGARSGVVGYSGAGSAPAGPGKTGVYGEATQDTASRGVSGFSLAGQGVRGEATTGQGVQGTATSGHGVHGDATANGTGVVGYSGALPAPTPPVKTGVYGEANQDSTARGVSGKTTIGQAVRADATSGIAVRAVATTGYALFASGRVRMDRSGLANVPANQTYVDVTVPGGTSASALAFANLQIKRTGVYVAAARPAYPSATKMRIYLNKVASTTATTPVAWMVLS